MPEVNKIVVFKGPDGAQWCFAAEVVAHNRATFYADEGDYKGEFEYALNDVPELKDWLFNNMNFEDFGEYVRPYKAAKPFSAQQAWEHPDSEQTVEVQIAPKGFDLPKPPQEVARI